MSSYMSYANVGKVWSVESFDEYLNSVKKPSWCNAICLHHTAAPSLSMRPQGLLSQHIRNMEAFYKAKEWRAGPHFFIDENEIFGMTPPNLKGVHAVSFNSNAIGIEVLGDYDTEFHNTGRGLDCWKTAAAATGKLLKWLNLGLNYNTVLFHRDDPKTRKSCPGIRVQKHWFIALVKSVSSNTEQLKPAQNTAQQMQFVKVSEYMQTVKGYSSEDIAKMLKRDTAGLFLFGEEWLEDAYYDSKQQTTMAPIKELCSLPKKK
jgi:N-acetylmuramoyl-L-alanine amidase CwlA